jgi:Glycosyl transferase family 2
MPPPPPDPAGRAQISAVVVSYNRAWSIATCLAAVAFADEVILVDKSSTDGTPELGACHADRVIRVPWSPTVEETRAFAVAQARHDWVLLLDDDECLSVEAVAFIAAELAAPRADIYFIPQRHYILGCHDERSYYWPEWQLRLFRRGTVSFGATVHGPMTTHSERVYRIPPETGACMHHLSHSSVAEWIEKANRYTSRPDRVRADFVGADLPAFAHAAIDRWRDAGRPEAPDDMPSAVALLRAVYDIIDRLKTWEEERGLDGAAAFRAISARLLTEYSERLGHLHHPHRAAAETEAAARPAGTASAEEPPRIAALRSMLDALRTEMAATRTRLAAEQDAAAADRGHAQAEQARLSGERDDALARQAGTEAALREQQDRVRALEVALRGLHDSTIWRASAPLRRFATRHRGLVRRVRRALRVARWILGHGRAAGPPPPVSGRLSRPAERRRPRAGPRSWNRDRQATG